MDYKTMIKKRKGMVVIITSIILGMTTFSFADIQNQEVDDVEVILASPSDAMKENQPVSTPSNIEKEKIEISDGFKVDEVGTKYYMDNKPIISSFAVIREDLYYFDDNGYMQLGWYFDIPSDKWYYFGTDGASEEGWIFEEAKWYYLEDGKYAVGWKEIQSDDGNSYWFYFDENGRMYEDEQTPDGYYVNEDGVYIQGPQISGYDDSDFEWDKDPNTEPGQLSGLNIAGYPAELYMLCIAGETSGMSNVAAVKNGDKGSAYGICQLDYRYDLVGFMKFAYDKHPNLWPSFSNYISCGNGNLELKRNEEIGNAFLNAMEIDYETAITDQLEFMTNRYWTGFKQKMDAAGFNLDERNIAVSAALFSVNVNCGTQPNIFINNLSPAMSDEEMIRNIYKLRNTVFAQQKVGKTFKGTTTRYRKSEPQMALDLLYGYTTIDSNVSYGGGVEWHGNPFTSIVTTVQKESRILYTPEDMEFTSENDLVEESVEDESLENIPIETETSETMMTETVMEQTEEMVQLIDGTWIEKSKSGPGYEYMPIDETEESIELITADE